MILTAGQTVYAQETSLIGSIGVISVKSDITKFLDMQQIDYSDGTLYRSLQFAQFSINCRLMLHFCTCLGMLSLNLAKNIL